MNYPLLLILFVMSFSSYASTTRVELETAIMEAAIKGDSKKIETYPKESINFARAKDGKTALMLASMNGHLEAVESLIKYRAIIDLTDDNSKTALVYACQSGYCKIVNLLIAAHADVNMSLRYGRSPLLMAAASFDEPLVLQSLVDAGAKIDHQTKYGETPLLEACREKKIKNILKLIELGADVRIPDDDGATPLGESFFSLEITKALLKAGADVEAIDRFEDSVLERLTKYKASKEILDLISNHVPKGCDGGAGGGAGAGVGAGSE